MASVAFHHVAISCGNLKTTEAFYSKHFGFTRARAIPLGGGNEIVFLKNGSFALVSLGFAPSFLARTALAAEPGRVFTRGQLLDAVHGVAIESYERAIDAHVKNIRRKIEPRPGSPRYLLTVHGVGYRFADA